MDFFVLLSNNKTFMLLAKVSLGIASIGYLMIPTQYIENYNIKLMDDVKVCF